MKEIFKNTKGFNTVKINLDCKAGNIDLVYQLIDNPVQHIWQEIYLNTKSFEMGIPMNISIDRALDLLNDACNRIGMNYLPKNFTQDDLNKFHATMVSESKISSKKELTLINNLIHVLETRLKNKYVDYCATVIFYSQDNQQFIPIKEEYKLWLESNTKWGDLFLGYGTLGKDWLDIYHDQDNNDDLQIQKTLSSETHLSFRTEYNFPKANEILFYRWAKECNFAVPLDNLNSLSLGRYCLGKIVIDKNMLSHHNIIGDWYIPNHICKLTWNRDIIGDNAVVKNLHFYDDNAFQEMSINHAQIRSIL